MKLFVVGKLVKDGPVGERVWELGGVFESEPLAIAACKGTNYFIGPIELNFVTPEEVTEWPGCYFPNA